MPPTGTHHQANQANFTNSTDLLRLPAVLRQTGLGRSTIYRLIACKKFPLPVRLTGRAVGWRKANLDQWNASLPTATHCTLIH